MHGISADLCHVKPNLLSAPEQALSCGSPNLVAFLQVFGSSQPASSLQHAVGLCALLSCGGTESADSYVMYLHAVD